MIPEFCFSFFISTIRVIPLIEEVTIILITYHSTYTLIRKL